MKKIILLGWLGLFLSQVGWSIGRSGNGTISSSASGFTAAGPADFSYTESLANERLRLISPVVDARPGMIGRPFLELGEANQLLPDFGNLPRLDLKVSFLAAGWVQQLNANPCIDAYTRHSEDGDLLAAYWGTGKGLVVVGPHSPYVRNGEREILSTLLLQEGACAW